MKMKNDIKEALELWSVLESKDAKSLKTILEKSIEIGY